MVRTVCSRSPTPVPASQTTSRRTCSSGSGAAVLPAAAAAPASASRWCTRWSPRTAAPSPLPVLPTAAPGSPCGSRPQTRSRSATAARALRPWAEQPLDADLGAGGEAVATVLVVEDERKLRELLRSYLEHDGLTVLSTASGAEAIRLTRDTAPDLLVLDLRLPDVPGEEVAREVRRFSLVPILVLTAKTATDDRIHCLELGADDYVTKPFSPREVILRVRAILRRAHSGLVDDAPTSYGDGELILDESRRQALVRGHSVELTTTEWRLLTTLAGAPGRVFSRYELINRTRGYEFEGYERTVDSHVRNLRHKLEADPHEPLIVQTVVGAGYRFGLRHDRPHTSQQAR